MYVHATRIFNMMVFLFQSDIVERSGEVGQGRSAFQLKEEKGPDGATHGGYGYVDKEGDLHLVEYKKDREGRMYVRDD